MQFELHDVELVLNPHARAQVQRSSTRLARTISASNTKGVWSANVVHLLRSVWRKSDVVPAQLVAVAEVYVVIDGEYSRQIVRWWMKDVWCLVHLHLHNANFHICIMQFLPDLQVCNDSRLICIMQILPLFWLKINMHNADFICIVQIANQFAFLLFSLCKWENCIMQT